MNLKLPAAASGRFSKILPAEPPQKLFMSRFAVIVFLVCCFFLFAGETRERAENIQKSAPVDLIISLELNRRIYDYSDYGEPPQLAAWIEQPGRGIIRTLFVTFRTAKGNWKGKIECPVSLPYWITRYNKESGRTGLPNRANPVPDAITGATPRHKLTVKSSIPAGGSWFYYIEVNCSGDYNISFPAVFDGGMPDPQGNGQPSLVYRGRIEALPGREDIPKLTGRSDQLDPIDTLETDLSGITNAKNLFKKIKVSIATPVENASLSESSSKVK